MVGWERCWGEVFFLCLSGEKTLQNHKFVICTSEQKRAIFIRRHLIQVDLAMR